MKRFLITLLFLTASGPALAFDLPEFLKAMTSGADVEPTPPMPDQTAANGSTDAPVQPVATTRLTVDGFELDSIWLLGVFR